ncbi:TetR/AcrR family transcriptional regulator [Nocardia sp. CA-120079]|uniref:TetR/AcrR family transcriptional regulator n=1 Tax=Nocardia sp. CA-120079 TaxID=3239974 RepID=UPI003D99BBAC
MDTAARLFGERGIADTSTNRIAAEAEVSIGTVYRYFSDRAVIVDELGERLLARAERRFTDWVSGFSQQPIPQLLTSLPQLITELLEVFTEELVANAKLMRALMAGVPFYSSSIPQFEPRVRLLLKVLLIQIIGPGNDHKYDVMTFVLINTGFAGVLRATDPEVDPHERQEAVVMTAQMIAAWIEAEVRAAQLSADTEALAASAGQDRLSGARQ